MLSLTLCGVILTNGWQRITSTKFMNSESSEACFGVVGVARERQEASKGPPLNGRRLLKSLPRVQRDYLARRFSRKQSCQLGILKMREISGIHQYLDLHMGAATNN